MIEPSKLQLTLRPLSMGEPPQSPPLRRDARGIVIGPQALVLLKHQHDRAIFLALLSHELDLSTGIILEQIPSSAGDESSPNLITIHPPADDTPLSLFYDRIQDAIDRAHLTTRVWFCIGGRATSTLSIFVPYADPSGPAGFDVDGTIPDSPQRDTIPHDMPQRAERLVLTPGQSWWITETVTIPLREILLELPLQRAQRHGASRPLMLSLLTDRRMAALIATYIQRHLIEYVVRFLTWQRGDRTFSVALFDIRNANDGQAIPAYVIDFLARLPRTTLLTDALEPATLEHEPLRRILVAYGYTSPFYLPNVQELLPPASLLLLSDGIWQSALLERLSPRHTMQQIVRTDAPARAYASINAADINHLRVSFQLRRDDSRRSRVHGILLDERGKQRLRRMLRSLPGPLFTHLRIAVGEGFAVILTESNSQTITGIPFGQPVARADPPELLLPTGMSLFPLLPPEILTSILELRPDTITLLTSTQRYDLPLHTFFPLSQLVVSPPNETVRSVRLQPSPLPPLNLDDLVDDTADKPSISPPPYTTPLPTPPAPAQPIRTSVSPPPQRGLRGFLQQLTPGGTSRRPAAEPISASFTEELREEAYRLEQAGEYEVAAAFYRYLHEDRRAAHCYRRLLKQHS